uniref:Uncharacterized protein n=2 Tax=Culex quinquefasciatus TaxID=7176 RepID=A0A1S4K3X4_CULQU
MIGGGLRDGRGVRKLSEYATQLPQEEKKRYLNKIAPLSYTDPYTATLRKDYNYPTTVTVGHAVKYILDCSTTKKFNNARSVEAYKKFEAGFVNGVEGGRINDLHLVRAKISHSMRLHEKPLTVWVVVEKDGNVQSAHCDCVAGLGETCSHVSTLLYALANLHHMTTCQKLTVTQLPAYWARPAKRFKDDLYRAIKDIDYGFKISHFADIEIHSSESDFMDFVSLLADDDDEPVLRRKFCKANALCRDCRSSQIPNEIMFNSNILLSRLHSLTLETLGAERIAEEARNVNLVLTDEEVNEIENLTRKQAKCELWGWVRIGRITASIFLECIHARTDSVPAKMSLLKKICHPDFSEINSAAVRYGKANETKASLVVQKLLEGHQNVRFDECGIFVDKTRPYLAATPDLIMRCDCCGIVCIEIKCPFRLAKKSQLNKDLKITDLDFIDGNDGTLKEQHKYFW